jgi:hypothetical protein
VEVFWNTEHRFEQAVRVVESGTVESTVLDGLKIDLADLF